MVQSWGSDRWDLSFEVCSMDCKNGVLQWRNNKYFRVLENFFPHFFRNLSNKINVKKRCVPAFKNCVMFKVSSFNGRPSARWFGRKEAALVIGRSLVTLAELGGLTRAYWITTIQLGRQRRKASPRGPSGPTNWPVLILGRLENIYLLLVCTRAWPSRGHPT